MNIGVIGSSGFIGTCFVQEVLKGGHIVYAWDVVMPREVIEDEKFHFSVLDQGMFCNEKWIQNCDAVVILAAKRPYNEFGIKDYLGNIELVANCIEVCIQNCVDNIVIISSRSVYSDRNQPWKEDFSNVPFNLYGAGKAAVDELIKWYNHQYQMNIKSLRLAQVIGMGERKGYLLNTFIDQAIAKETLHIWGTGAGRRQYIYVKDVVRAITAACESDKPGIYNIGMPDNISIRELADVINEVFDNQGNLSVDEGKPEDLAENLMDISKAKRELNWEPAYTIEMAMRDIKESIRGEK